MLSGMKDGGFIDMRERGDGTCPSGNFKLKVADSPPISEAFKGMKEGGFIETRARC